MSKYTNPTGQKNRKIRYPFRWVWQNTVCVILVVLLIGGGTFGILRYFTEYAEAIPDSSSPKAIVTLSPTLSSLTPTPSTSQNTYTLPASTPTPVPTPTPKVCTTGGQGLCHPVSRHHIAACYTNAY